MGGFMEYDGNQPIRVLLSDELESYSLTGNGDFPRISKAEIDDRSKGDAISKAFVILQTGWFVAQVIARGVQGLPITELELVTVAFAALNFVIYILWWDKPLNVQRGVRVYKKRITEEPVDDGDVEATVGFWVALRDALSGLPAAVVRGPRVPEFDPWLARVSTWPLLKPLHAMLGVTKTYAKRVDTFYPTDWVSQTEGFSYILVVLITLTFGGIHCIGWSFIFPSSTERTLWRVASLCITGVPMVLFLLIAAIQYMRRYSHSYYCAVISVILLLVVYVLCRLTLLVLPFLCLKSLPPAAFHVVHWTSFIPHVL
jgi:hypothetical protein